jgi:hypothetical protein
MMNNQEIKNKILEDIAAAQEQGYTLIMEDWGSSKMKCACALGCVNIGRGNRPDYDMRDVGVALGVKDPWINSFTDGFDDNGVAAGAQFPEAWQMGEQIRQEKKPIPFHEFVDQMDEQ